MPWTRWHLDPTHKYVAMSEIAVGVSELTLILDKDVTHLTNDLRRLARTYQLRISFSLVWRKLDPHVYEGLAPIVRKPSRQYRSCCSGS